MQRPAFWEHAVELFLRRSIPSRDCCRKSVLCRLKINIFNLSQAAHVTQLSVLKRPKVKLQGKHANLSIGKTLKTQPNLLRSTSATFPSPLLQTSGQHDDAPHSLNFFYIFFCDFQMKMQIDERAKKIRAKQKFRLALYLQIYTYVSGIFTTWYRTYHNTQCEKIKDIFSILFHCKLY